MGLEDANLVKNRDNCQATLLGDVKYGDGLRLDTLCGVYQQKRALGSCQRTGNFP